MLFHFFVENNNNYSLAPKKEIKLFHNIKIKLKQLSF